MQFPATTGAMQQSIRVGWDCVDPTVCGVFPLVQANKTGENS